MGKNVIISTLPNISQNYLPKVNTSNIFANSLVYDNGTSVMIDTTTTHSSFANARLVVNRTGNSYIEIRAISGQSALALTTGTSSASATPTVEFFNSGNFGIVAYRPGVVSSNYLMYYNLSSSTNRYLAIQTEGQDRITINQNGTIDLTGALSGTSATFSGLVEIGNTSGSAINSASGLGNLVVGNGGASSQGITIYTGSSTYGGLNFADATSGGGAYAGYIKFDHSNDSMGFFIGNTQRLTISSTGAATFSSSLFAGNVSATRSTIGTIDMGFSGSGYPGIGYNIDYTATNGTYKYKVTDTSWMLELGNSNTFKLRYAASGTAGTNISYTDFLTISSTGAATFSSSVRSNSHIIVSDGSSANVVLQGYINNALRIAASGSGSSGGSRGDLYVGAIDVGGAATFSSSVTAAGQFTSTLGNNARIFYSGTATTGYQYMGIQNTSGYLLIGVEGSTTGQLATSDIAYSSGIYTANSTPIHLGSNQVVAMTLVNGGNVGIGTTSPNSKLDILGANNVMNIAGTNTVSAYLGWYYNTSTLVGYIGNGSSILSGAASSDFIFRSEGALVYATSGNNERMRITSGGNVGIGTTGSSTIRLVVCGSGTSSAADSFQAADVNGNTLFRVRNDGLIYTGTASLSPYNYGVSGVALYVASSGAIGYSTSTRESKANISIVDNVNWIHSLQPVTFNKRKKDNEGNYTEELESELQYGLIAEDVESINPNFVFYNNEGKLAGVHYDRLITPLVKAIQEQQAQIEEQKADIESLKALINK